MNVSAKLYCKKSKRKLDGTAPVYIILRINNKEKLIATGKYVNHDQFDNNSGRVGRGEANSMKLNAYLGAKLALIEKIILDFQHEGKDITHDQIINAYESDGKLLFIDFCMQELEASKSTIVYTYYKTTKYQLEKLNNYRPGLTIQQITFDFLQKYQYYLVEKCNEPNTMKSDFIMIRKFLNLAIKKGLTKNYPFKDFEIPSEEAVKEYLTLKEVESLHTLYDSNTLSEKLQNTLFYFLIACYPDRGSQYASKDYQELLNDNSVSCSMSRKGNCYDNATMESFFATLKQELIYHRHYQTRQEARQDIFEYIQVWYNRKRKHLSLNYMSPEQFENLSHYQLAA